MTVFRENSVKLGFFLLLLLTFICFFDTHQHHQQRVFDSIKSDRVSPLFKVLRWLPGMLRRKSEMLLFSGSFS